MIYGPDTSLRCDAWPNRLDANDTSLVMVNVASPPKLFTNRRARRAAEAKMRRGKP